MSICLQLFFLVSSATSLHRNNICTTFLDYHIKDLSPNCFYNPDADDTAENIAKRHGYPLERYEAVTSDEFVLTVFRISPKDGISKGTIFLQHPASASSTVWLTRGNESFAFMLSDAGYDVWLGNFRGTSYSQVNKKYSRILNAKQYWNYSLHEFGLYDLSAQIELVQEKTNNKDKIIFIGHSVATSALLVYSSLKPAEAEKNIKLSLLWSPIAYLENVKTPIRAAAPFYNIIKVILNLIHDYGMVYNGVTHKLIKQTCLSIPSFLGLCSIVIDKLTGPQYKQGNPIRLPVLLYQSFEGFSTKAIIHFGQLYSANKFEQYDYGLLKNKVYYNSVRPPQYPLEKISIPIYLVYGGNDYLATEKDTYTLYDSLPYGVKLGVKKVESYSHFDFHYGRDVKELLHLPTLKYIEEFNG